MKIAILTTDTLHHVYFIQKIHEKHKDICIIEEKNILRPEFDVFHPFERGRDYYEEDYFFGGKDKSILDLVSECDLDKPGILYHSVDNINEGEGYLRSYKPDVIIVFGTSRIKKGIIDICSEAIVNLHGGDPESYRGLDSNLWAIYHDDFNCKVTLHDINEKFDDGDIISKDFVYIKKDMKLYEIRAEITMICIAMALEVIHEFSKGSEFFNLIPQLKKGEVYHVKKNESPWFSEKVRPCVGSYCGWSKCRDAKQYSCTAETKAASAQVRWCKNANGQD